QLVVLGDTIGATGGAGLDLTSVGSDGNVRNRRILGFAAAVADDGGVTVAASQLDGVERLRQRADLVHLDEDAVGRILGYAFPQARCVGDKEVVAHQLHLVAQLARQLLPAGPVVLGQAVLEGSNRPAGAKLLPQVDHLVG